MLCRLRGDGGIPGRRVGWRCTITGVRAYVGVTDNNWYRFLAGRPKVTEVNFWQPSGAREFRTSTLCVLAIVRVDRVWASLLGVRLTS